MSSGWSAAALIRPWTADDRAQLAELRAAGHSLRYIARLIGRTEAAISCHLKRQADKGLAPRTTRRECLCCGKPFSSQGPHNRCCPRCAAKSVSPYAL